MSTKYPQGQEGCVCVGLPPAPLPTVTRLVIARLYNLGNFEHKRIEVEVVIPPGASAAKALTDTETFLDNLHFSPPVEEYQIASAQEHVRWSDEQWQEQRGPTWEKDKADEIAELGKLLSELEVWKQEQKNTRLLLDSIGAVEV